MPARGREILPCDAATEDVPETVGASQPAFDGLLVVGVTSERREQWADGSICEGRWVSSGRLCGRDNCWRRMVVEPP